MKPTTKKLNKDSLKKLVREAILKEWPTAEEYAEKDRVWRSSLATRNARINRFIDAVMTAVRPLISEFYAEMENNPEWNLDYQSVQEDKMRLEKIIGSFVSQLHSEKRK